MQIFYSKFVYTVNFHEYVFSKVHFSNIGL